MIWGIYKIYMDINFEYYKVFYCVARYGSITKAASALGGSQPNVTRMIKLLEAQLGCRLFVREPRGIRLTETGERLFVHVQAAWEHLMAAQEEIRGQDVEHGGTIEVGTTEAALHLFLLEALRDFRMEYPKIRIKVHNHSTKGILKDFGAGNLDFAVVTTPFETPEGVLCETMCQFKEILAGGMQYRHLAKGRAALEDLATCPWIGLGRGTATGDLYQDFFRRHNVDITLDMEVATSDLLIPLIRNNLGIGFVPESMAAPLINKKALVEIPIACQPPGRTVKLISEKGRGRTRAAEMFYRYLKGRVAAQPGGCR